LINEDALEAIPEIERKRQEAIFELIQTEAAYLSSLQQLVGTFFAALQPIVPDRTAEVLFSNVEQLLLSNTSFYSDLEDRQRESRLFVDRIGDVVFRYAQRALRELAGSLLLISRYRSGSVSCLLRQPRQRKQSPKRLEGARRACSFGFAGARRTGRPRRAS
jgi:hypothetical protein